MSDNDIITATGTANAREDRLWQRLFDLKRRCADLQPRWTAWPKRSKPSSSTFTVGATSRQKSPTIQRGHGRLSVPYHNVLHLRRALRHCRAVDKPLQFYPDLHNALYVVANQRAYGQPQEKA
jgi:hypothetical protein